MHYPEPLDVLPQCNGQGIDGAAGDCPRRLFEPDVCSSVVSAMNQARDDMLMPPNRDLQPRESFAATVRHTICKVRDVGDLEPRWSAFLEDVGGQGSVEA